MLDVAIINGTMVDGTGAPPRPADIGIEGDRIVRVGDDLSAAPAKRRQRRSRVS